MTTEAGPRKTLDQKRAHEAYQAVKGVAGLSASQQSDYASRARELPAMLLKSGIGQTLAFLLSKNKDNSRIATAEGRVVAQLDAWVGPRVFGMEKFPVTPTVTMDRLLKAVIDGDRSAFQRATDEAMAYATWLKRFAEAFLAESDQGASHAG